MRKVRYKRGIFIQLLLLPLLAVLVVGSGSYIIYLNEMGKRLDISLEASVEQLQGRVDNVVYNLSRIYQEEVDTASIRELAGQDVWNQYYSGVKDIQKQLQGPLYLSQYIKGYSLVNLKYGWVLSNRGLYALEEAINYQEVEALFEEAGKLYSQSSFWENQVGNRVEADAINRLEVNVRGLSRVVKIPLLARECDMLLIINVDMQQLGALARQGTGEYGMTILDDRRRLVYTDSQDTGDIVRQLVPGETLGLGGHTGDFVTVREGGLRMAVSHSGLSGWTYIASYDRSMVSDGGNGILLLAFLVILVLFVEFILAYHGTERIYAPVGQLVKYALGIDPERAAPGTNEKQNEFTYISTAMGQLAASNADLVEVVESQKMQLQELLIRRILNGEIQGETVADRMGQMGLKPGRYLYVVSTAMRMDMDGGGIGDTMVQDTRKDIIFLSIVNNMPTGLAQISLMGPFWNGTVLFSLISADDRGVVQEKVLKYQHDLEEYVQSMGKIFVYSGVSNVFCRLDGLKKAYGESLEALKNNEAMKRKCQEEIEDKYDLVFFEDSVVQYQKTLYYDMNCETRIKEAVADCDEKLAGTVTEEFLGSLAENKVIFQERTLALYKYLAAVLSVAGAAGLSVNEIFEGQNRDLFSELNSIYGWDRIGNFYKEMVIRPVIQKLREFREGSVDSLLNQILNLVRERKGNITLGECADILGHHPSYIWKIMTSRMHVTFSEYLAGYKMDLARSLLLETDMTIAEIAEQLNYTSAQNFNRFFTKYEKVSPGKFRKMNRG